MDVMHEEVAFIRGGRGRVSSDTDDAERKLMVSLAGVAALPTAWVTPSEARALAALLLKHADRAEGRGDVRRDYTPDPARRAHWHALWDLLKAEGYIRHRQHLEALAYVLDWERR